MTTTAHATDTFTITETVLVRATIEKTFASLLVQMGRQNARHDGTPMPMVIEPFPGGRWYRELGGDNGHLWGFVQSIKRPALLEIWGPLMISTGATSNLMYRLSEVDGGTQIAFTHTMFGPVPDGYRANLHLGWSELHTRVREAAEADGGDILG